jgi:catechol 2,3-dioxygenase-like lactoylglutathione lyase family enzyme
MTATYTAKKISPMLAVADMTETLAFYRDILGFNPMMKSAEYAIVERDGQTIHFMKAASEEVMNCVRGTPRSTSKFPTLPRCGSM